MCTLRILVHMLRFGSGAFILNVSHADYPNIEHKVLFRIPNLFVYTERKILEK